MMLKVLGKTIANKFGFDIIRHIPRDFTKEDSQIIKKVKPFTMTSPEKLYGLIHAVRYIIRNKIPGDFVECGVWRGGSMMAVALTLLELGVHNRQLHLFDSFQGMPQPGEKDDELSKDIFRKLKGQKDGSNWCIATEAEAIRTMYCTGYPQENIHVVKGMVEDTIPDKAPECISLLRLDTDWYDSTSHELTYLFPRISKFGVLILDDYGAWGGAKQAVDEFIDKIQYPLFLNRLDDSGRITIKGM